MKDYTLDQQADGTQRSIYAFGSKTSQLDVSTTEAKIDTDDMISCVKKGGSATFVNTSGETITLKGYTVDDASEDWDTNPGAFSQVLEVEVPAGGSKSINWVGFYPNLQWTKDATGAVLGGLYGKVYCNGAP